MNLNNSDFSEKEKITRTDIIYAVNINKSLANLDLSGVMLNEISLYSGDFKNAKMCGVDFYGTYITDTDFSGADLSYADFRFAIVKNCDFTGAVLNGVKNECAVLEHIKIGYRTVNGEYMRFFGFFDEKLKEKQYER
jgi:uncharacterized protein YjbI with pentapeptide repeats